MGKHILLIPLLFLGLISFSQTPGPGSFGTLKAKSLQIGTSQKIVGINGSTWGTDSTNVGKLAAMDAINKELNRRLSQIVNIINTADTLFIHNTAAGVGVAVGNVASTIVFKSFLPANGNLITGQDSTITIDRRIFSGTATLDFPSTAAQNTSALSITVTGAAVGDPVAVGYGAVSMLTGHTYTAYVSTANTVLVVFVNTSASAYDPPSASFTVKVIK